MTDLATQARAAAQHAEVRFHARRDHGDSGASLLTVEVMTEELPECVSTASPGQRFIMVLVPIADDGSPKAIPVKSRGHRLNDLAHAICKEPEFQRWAIEEIVQSGGFPVWTESPDTARRLILDRCDITDRGKLVGNEAACDHFEILLDQFHRAHGRRYFFERERTT